MRVLHGDVGELLPHLRDSALPQRAGVRQHIRLVHPGQLPAPRLCAIKGIADDALNAEAGVLGDLAGHLVGGSAPQTPAVATVEPLGPLAHDNEVDRARRLQR